MSSKNLSYFERLALDQFLRKHPELHELYQWKERLHKFYRTYGYMKAYRAYKRMMDEMSVSFLPEITDPQKNPTEMEGGSSQLL